MQRPILESSTHSIVASAAAYKADDVSLALRIFPSLPDEARVDVDVVMALFGIGRSTVWAWLKQQRLPEPVRDGKTTRWTAGALRDRLKGTAK